MWVLLVTSDNLGVDVYFGIPISFEFLPDCLTGVFIGDSRAGVEKLKVELILGSTFGSSMP